MKKFNTNKCRKCGKHKVYKDGLCTLCYFTDYGNKK